MSDNPLVEQEIKNDAGSPLPASIIGASTSTPIGNVSDALKVSIASEIITTFSRTYTAAILNLSPASAATDFFTLSGISGGKVRIIALDISATRTNTGYVDFLALLRSTDNSGGTFTLPSPISHESTDSASAAIVKAYTANPTLGTLRGNIHAQKLFIPSANAASASGDSSIDIIKNIGKPITLLSPSEIFALNLNGQTVAGGLFNISISWIED